MAQEFTREKLSAADAFGNPVYIGSTKTTIHTVPANSQDTITLYLKFGRTARCEVTLFRSDGTNDYELPTKYLGASGSIVPVEITNVQAGNTIKAQLSGASPNTKIYVTSGEVSNAYVDNTYENSSYELVIFTDKYQTGTPRYLNASDFNWGSYTAPTDFRYVQAFKYFPATGYFVFAKSSGTGAGWWAYDVYEDRVAFYSSSYEHVNTGRGVVWFENTAAYQSGTAGITINFTDPANPVLTSTTGLTNASSQAWYYKVSNDIYGVVTYNSSAPSNTYRVNNDGTTTYLSTENSINYQAYERFAAATFANGNYYVSRVDQGANYGGIYQVDPTTGAITVIESALTSPFNSYYTNIVVACPERNEFWYFRNASGSYDIGKYDLATSTLTTYANSNDVANTVGARAFYDSTTDLIWVQDGNKYIGWDPDTQTWARDVAWMTDVNPGGAANNIGVLGVINNGTNDYLFGGGSGLTSITYYNLDTSAEGTVSGSGTNKWDNAVHNATNAVYMSGQDDWLDHWDFSSTTPSHVGAIDGSSITGFGSQFFQLYVDQTNNHLYATDYNSNLHKFDINASTGALTHNSIVNSTSSAGYREYPTIIDVANQKYIKFGGGSIYWADMSTNATFFNSITFTNAGIESGITDYSSSFRFAYTASSPTMTGAVYDEANNMAYVSFRYYSSASTYKTGILKLDISQIDVSNSDIYVNHYMVDNDSYYVYLGSQKNLEGNIIAVNGLMYTRNYYVDVSTGSITQVTPTSMSSTVYGSYYDSGTDSIYFSGANYLLEAQYVTAPEGEGPILNDFSVLTRPSWSDTGSGQAGYLGANTHTENNYSDASSAQRTNLDIEKGNGATGHVNRVTTTA